MKPLAQNSLIQNRYLIVHLIGKGGMGEVYLAVDQRLGSAVALKRTFFAGDVMLGTAFEREARILARMRHPVLPKVSDHFSENDEQYLVMEHIAGDDLAKRLEVAQKPFPVTWVLFWADQLLDALSYLHSHEPPIIHRDIKPQNLKLTDENHIILLDFGLSKSSTGQTHLSASGGSTGSVVGYTPHYAPMEQIRGIGTNARSDIYSLSATLYQLMTGVVPSDALTRADTMLNEMPDPIKSPHELNPEIPGSVSEIILKGMEVSQEKRFSTAREMQKLLRQAFNEMQEAMKARTVAFNVQNEVSVGAQPSGHATEVLDAAEILSAPLTASHPSGENVSQPATPLDFDATLAFDPTPPSNSVRQADVKTEVFIGGLDSLPETANSDPRGSNSKPETAAVASRNENEWSGSNPGPTNSYSANDVGPHSTAPYVPLEETGPSPEAFYTTPAYRDQTSYSGAAAGAAAGAGAGAATDLYAPRADSQPRPAARSHAAPARSSAGKAFLVLGGLAAMFILAFGAAGAGWYVYQNYYSGITEEEAMPTPEPSPEPSPEPTPDTIFGVNTSDPGSSLDSDMNTNTADPVAEPAPTSAPGSTASGPPATPRTTPRTSRPSQTAKPDPTKPVTAPTVSKPTPKPTPTPRRPGILQ